jgi:hypothetical protein
VIHVETTERREVASGARTYADLGKLGKSHPGSVYFVRVLTDPPSIKIGHTRHLNDRLIALQRDCPWPIEMLTVVEGSRALEMRFHAKFFTDHVRGEWFRATDELLACIARINGPNGYPVSELPARGVMLYGPQAERLRAHG